MNRIKKLRRIAALVLVAATSLTLAACSSSEKTPYGDLSKDNVYLSYSGYDVNQIELYDQLRMQSASNLANMIDDILFKDYINTAKTLLASGDEDTLTYFYDTVNKAIFSDTDADNLKDLFDNNHDQYVRDIEQYADTLYLADNTLDIDAIKTALLSLETPFEGYESISSLVNKYQLIIAERIYAKEQLATEVDDSESTSYIADSDVVNYYQANTEGRYDVNALVIRFLNLNEANAALYQTGLKSDSKGLWYQIPDIRIAEGQSGYIDLTNQSQYGYIVDILDNLNLLGKLGENYADRSNLSVADYENYYKSYVISTTRDTGYRDTALTTAEVKAKFVEIYNLLNPAATIQVAEDGSIVGASNNDFSTVYTYDDLTDLNTSLRSHIYNTLTAETLVTDPTTEKPYSSRVQTFGDYRYLVFKLDDNSASEDGILIDDPENDGEQIFSDTASAVAAKEQARADLIDSKLTSSYISTKVSELLADKSIDIYDYVVRTFYSQSFDYTGTTKNQTGDVVATVDGTDITVEQLYAELEQSYGISISMDLAFNKYLEASDKYTVSKTDMADYKSQFETILTNFSADSYSSYPASMGREAFLLVAFGSKTNEEAINQLYVYPDLRKQYLDDYEAHFSNDNKTIYEKFAELSQIQYDNAKSINVSHLLIYFDQNGDGTPDDPSTYLDGLSASSKQAVLTGLVNLVNLIYSKVGDYTDFATALSSIADEFNSTGRIERGSATPPYDYQLELVWAEYRRLGFNLKYEAISSDITNSSNIMTNSSILDKVFYDRAISLYDTLSAAQEADPTNDSLFPYLDFYDEVQYGSGITETDLNNVESSFGWHLILAENLGEKSSAIYSAADDTGEDYIDTTLNLNAYNENSDTLTASQIEYYLVENATDEGASLPTAVSDAITAYLQPVLTIYDGTYMQRELIFRLLNDTEFTNSADAVREQTIREINIRQLNSYLLSNDGGVYDENYAALYGSLFTILES